MSVSVDDLYSGDPILITEVNLPPGPVVSVTLVRVGARRPGHCFPLPRPLPCLACHYRTHQGTGLLASQRQYWAL